MNLLILSGIGALVLGTLNWMYWRSQGYSNWSNIVLSYFIAFAVSYLILKYFL